MSDAPAERKTACITLDLENDWYFEESGYDHLTFEYIDEFVELISSLDVPLSIFAVGRTIERYPEVIDRLSNKLDCEFHLHSYSHDVSKSYDFEEEVHRGIVAYEEHFGDHPRGYRAPQGNITDEELVSLDQMGFDFDSSVFPSYRPGVYNNLKAPIEPYRPVVADSLLEIPIAATPVTRIPISHSYLKLLGSPYLRYLESTPLPNPLVFNVHLQDLYQTASHDRLDQPKRFIFKRNIDRSTSLFREFIQCLKLRNYEFVSITAILRNQNSNQIKSNMSISKSNLIQYLA